jgi:hypothetical protein
MWNLALVARASQVRGGMSLTPIGFDPATECLIISDKAGDHKEWYSAVRPPMREVNPGDYWINVDPRAVSKRTRWDRLLRHRALHYRAFDPATQSAEVRTLSDTMS